MAASIGISCWRLSDRTISGSETWLNPPISAKAALRLQADRQEFWERVAGDAGFYLDLVTLVQDGAVRLRPAYAAA